MKKLISCLLAVLLVCSLMSMSVFADGRVGGTDGDINDGVDTPDYDNNSEIKVNFGQTTTPDGETTPDGGNTNSGVIIHKYAVDITFGEFLLDLTELQLGDTNGTPGIQEDEKELFMVWDVNAHKYVLCFYDSELKEYVPADIGSQDEETTEDDVAEDVLETPITLTSTVLITNHSDLSIDTTVVLKSTNTDIDWTINAATAPTNETLPATIVNGVTAAADDTATQIIKKANAGENGANGTETNGTEYSFTATPVIDNGWIGVIGNLGNATTSATSVGSITITIRP